MGDKDGFILYGKMRSTFTSRFRGEINWILMFFPTSHIICAKHKKKKHNELHDVIIGIILYVRYIYWQIN